MGSFLPQVQRAVVTKQYPVEVQCQVQSQGAKNEAAMHFLAAKSPGAGKGSFYREALTQPTKMSASKRPLCQQGDPLLV